MKKTNKNKLHVTRLHEGKMVHMISLSTSPLVNPICKARHKDTTSVCNHCYSVAMNKRYKGLNDCLINNYNILTTRLLEKFEIDELGFHNYKYVRFEAFGDVSNAMQMQNFIKIAEYYKDTRFTLWTKNPLIVELGLKCCGYSKASGKPKNLNIILSSPKLNERVNSSFWFVDGVFSVYDKDFIKSNDVKINCGSKKCIDCLMCYKKHNKPFIVNEKLK